ncbi:Uncharacterised protein [Clostridium carnis]|uniref:Uncharacterized protein n=1 Tax=Clostridium carnis TaxID=1530 RepID=A0ABY6SNX4_9CLOT|nr:hypothetical protein [Clostridium carnis]VDG69855.1 Uncharacterised protein [Clostridium carnis]
MEEILKLIDESNSNEKDKIKTYIVEQEFMIRQLKKTNSDLINSIDKLMNIINEEKIEFDSIEKYFESILTNVEDNLK